MDTNLQFERRKNEPVELLALRVVAKLLPLMDEPNQLAFRQWVWSIVDGLTSPKKRA